MAVLKDIRCSQCDVVWEKFLDGNQSEIIAKCPECNRRVAHKSICSGGCKERWRYHDFTSDYIEERFRVKGVEAYTMDNDGNEVPVTHYQTGEEIVSASGVSDSDATEIRHDKIRARHKRRKGRIPIHVDLKSPSPQGV